MRYKKYLKYYFLLVILLLITISNAWTQDSTPEFSFQLYFEDAAGSKDTITLGYDPLATDSIDVAFGEVDISAVPWKASGLEVRISNPKNLPYTQYPDYETKKQIIDYECDNPNLKQLNIFTKNWPVTMAWESISVDSCLKGSFVTSYQPGGWFDVPGSSSMGVIPLFENESQGLVESTFTANASSNDLPPTGYINSNGDTVSAFWTVFATTDILTMGVKQNEMGKQIQVYPNPFVDNFKLSEDVPLDKMKMISLNGEEIPLRKEGELFIPEKCQTGMYFLIMNGEKGQYIFKLIKQ